MNNTELLTSWTSGNDAGRGFACGAESDTPRDAAARNHWTDIREIGPDGAVVARAPIDDELIVICNANGPWAVAVRRTT